MSWGLVALLSIPGLLMGLLSVRGHTRGIEPYLWLVLALFAILVIARSAGQRYFLHGLTVGIAWGVLNGLAAATWFPTYLAHNPVVQLGGGPLSTRWTFVLSGPLIGLATGLVLGTLCWAASHWIQPAPRIPL